MTAATDQPATSHADRALAILLHASDTLAAPDRWTKGAAARFDDGQVCYPANEYAATWCALGAVERGHANDIRQHGGDAGGGASAIQFSPYRRVLRYLGSALPDPFRTDEEGISRFNDHNDTTHQDIVDLLARAVGAADHDANMQAARQQQAVSS